MAEATIDSDQFDKFSTPIPRERVTAALEALGFDGHDLMEIHIEYDAVRGTGFVRGNEDQRILGPDGSGYLKFDFTARIQDEEG